MLTLDVRMVIVFWTHNANLFLTSGLIGICSRSPTKPHVVHIQVLYYEKVIEQGLFYLRLTDFFWEFKLLLRGDSLSL